MGGSPGVSEPPVPTEAWAGVGPPSRLIVPGEPTSAELIAACAAQGGDLRCQFGTSKVLAPVGAAQVAGGLHRCYLGVMVRDGFSSKVVLALTGITYRQLDYWVRTGLVGSSVRRASGRGSRRVYSFEDLVALRVVASLLGAGVSLQAIRRAVAYLKKHTARPLQTLGLTAQGKRIFIIADDPSRMIEATAHGQVVIAIAVEPIAQNLEADVAKLSAPRKIDVRVRGTAYRVVATPDLQVGGYSVTVPQLPGCITEGDTLGEARRMAREAIATWLDASSVPARQRARAR